MENAGPQCCTTCKTPLYLTVFHVSSRSQAFGQGYLISLSRAVIGCSSGSLRIALTCRRSKASRESSYTTAVELCKYSCSLSRKPIMLHSLPSVLIQQYCLLLLLLVLVTGEAVFANPSPKRSPQTYRRSEPSDHISLAATEENLKQLLRTSCAACVYLCKTANPGVRHLVQLLHSEEDRR